MNKQTETQNEVAKKPAMPIQLLKNKQGNQDLVTSMRLLEQVEKSELTHGFILGYN